MEATPNESTTPQDVERAKKLAEDIYIQIMDDWEESVPQNGEFFVKVGKVSENPMPFTDTRALILKEGMPMNSTGEPNLDTKPGFARDTKLGSEIRAIVHGENANNDVPDFLKSKDPTTYSEREKQYIAMTRKGLKIITVPAEDSQNFLLSKPQENDGFQYETGGEDIVWGGRRFRTSEITTGEEGEKFLFEVMTKSIEASRKTGENAKNKLALDAAKQEQAKAQRLSKLIDRFIQPHADQAPAAPPPPTL